METLLGEWEKRYACLQCCRQWFGKDYQPQGVKGALYEICLKKAHAEHGLMLPVPGLDDEDPDLAEDKKQYTQPAPFAIQSPWPNVNVDCFLHLNTSG